MSETSAALVTGASQGIGEAIAKRLAADGFAVGLIARRPEGLARVAAELLAQGRAALACPGDVGRREDVRAAIAAVERELGPIDVLVHCAGWGGPFHRADEVDDDEWNRVFDTNLVGARLLCETLLPSMAARGGGRIINIASVLGSFGGAGSSTYAASKHALIGYTRSLAVEWAASGITCNAVCPGFIATAMTGDEGFFDDERRREVLRGVPIGRFGRPEEVAALVAFLASAEAGFCTGGVHAIDGGLSARVT
ncbi:SDR family NAD(P)-dependent oxidoreductase [Nannocystaceae bacterium ST9]